MLVRKDLLEQLIDMAAQSAEYLNSGDHWITVKPHGEDSKGTHVLVKDGETSKQAVERKFGDGDKDKKQSFKTIMTKEQYEDFQDILSRLTNFEKEYVERNTEKMITEMQKIGVNKALGKMRKSLNVKITSKDKLKYLD